MSISKYISFPTDQVDFDPQKMGGSFPNSSEVGNSHPIFHLLQMQCGTPEMQRLLEDAVPRNGSRKSWFYQLSGELKMSTNRLISVFYDLRCALKPSEILQLYNYLDKRAADLARSRLLRARAHSQKVHWSLDNIKHGELNESHQERD